MSTFLKEGATVEDIWNCYKHNYKPLNKTTGTRKLKSNGGQMTTMTQEQIKHINDNKDYEALTEYLSKQSHLDTVDMTHRGWGNDMYILGNSYKHPIMSFFGCAKEYHKITPGTIINFKWNDDVGVVKLFIINAKRETNPKDAFSVDVCMLEDKE